MQLYPGTWGMEYCTLHIFLTFIYHECVAPVSLLFLLWLDAILYL